MKQKEKSNKEKEIDLLGCDIKGSSIAGSLFLGVLIGIVMSVEFYTMGQILPIIILILASTFSYIMFFIYQKRLKILMEKK